MSTERQTEPEPQRPRDDRKAATPVEAGETIQPLPTIATGGVDARRRALPSPPPDASSRPNQQAAMLRLQRSLGNRHMARLLAQQGAGDAPPSPSAVQRSWFSDDEAPADGGGSEPSLWDQATGAAADLLGGGGSAPSSSDGGSSAGGESRDGAAPRGTAPAAAGTDGALIVDDGAPPGPNQMSRAGFLAQVRQTVSAVATETLTDSPMLPLVGSEVDRRLATYSGLDAAALEGAIRREVPEAGRVASAGDFLPFIAARVRKEIAAQPAGGVADAAGELAGGIADAAGGLASGAAGVLSGIGNVLFKMQAGAEPGAPHPQGVRTQLGAGQALDGTAASEMGAAFGQDFSGVRVHADAQAATLASDFHARAFTVGQDVAFGAGEYRPGTPVGDALLAHELAHVVQQGGKQSAVAPLRKGVDAVGELEEDADRAAVGAVASLWGATKGAANTIARNAMPMVRSGLRLSRCHDTNLQNPEIWFIAQTAEEQEALDRIQEAITAAEKVSADPETSADDRDKLYLAVAGVRGSLRGYSKLRERAALVATVDSIKTSARKIVSSPGTRFAVGGAVGTAVATGVAPGAATGGAATATGAAAAGGLAIAAPIAVAAAAIAVIIATTPGPREDDLLNAWRQIGTTLQNLSTALDAVAATVLMAANIGGQIIQVAIHLARLLRLNQVAGQPPGEPPDPNNNNDKHWWHEIVRFCAQVVSRTKGMSRKQILAQLLKLGITAEMVAEIERLLIEAARRVAEEVPKFLPPN